MDPKTIPPSDEDSSGSSDGGEESPVNEPRKPAGEDTVEDAEFDEPSALEPIDDHVLGRHVNLVFRLWMVVFGLVGAQMGWVLRPFLGDPTKPFSWFRARESNFFEAILSTLSNIIMGR